MFIKSSSVSSSIVNSILLVVLIVLVSLYSSCSDTTSRSLLSFDIDDDIDNDDHNVLFVDDDSIRGVGTTTMTTITTTSTRQLHGRFEQEIDSTSSFESILSTTSTSTSTDNNLLETRSTSTKKNKKPKDDNTNNNNGTNEWIFGRPYYVSTIDDVGEINYPITYGNPFKGMCCNPNIYSPYETGVFFSLDGFYYGFDSVLIAPGRYNWTEFDSLLTRCVSQRQSHTIPRFFIHYPTSDVTIRLPQFLDNIEFRRYGTKKQFISPYYGDRRLLNAIKGFIYEFGRRYDGDERIAYIQAGILGFWGEFHCNGFDEYLLPEEVKLQVLDWYHDAFTRTPIQQRIPEKQYTKPQLHGYHDDSFAYSTLDGKYNGGVKKDNNFWSRVVRFNDANFWRTGPMGGEVRPISSEIIFKPTYPKNTEYHNDVYACINITHLTYLKNDYVFRSDTITEQEVRTANRISSLMGYTFYISQVEAAECVAPAPDGRAGGIILRDVVDIVVTIENLGVAPFYYPLGLSLMCWGLVQPMTIPNIQKQLIDQYMKRKYIFRKVPRNVQCLNTIELSLSSQRADITGNVIRLAQLDGTVAIAIPQPPLNTTILGRPFNQPIPPPVPKPQVTQNINFRYNLVDATSNKFLKKSLQNNEYIDITATGDELSIQVDIEGL